MRKLFLLLAMFTWLFVGTDISVYGQGISIGSPGNPPDSSAMLDVSSSQAPFKGTLITRLSTANRNSISSPATGLLIYNTDCNEIQYYDGGSWISMSLLMPLVATAGSGATQTQLTANWNAGLGATAYYLDVATDSGFVNFVSGYNSLNVGNVSLM